MIRIKQFSIGLVAAAASLLALSLPLQAQELSAPLDTEAVARNPYEAFKKGELGIRFRSFFMATDNEKALSDYYALAAGGALHFQTAPLHGFKLGIGGVFNFRLAASDLAAKDPSTGARNRYEIGLFDVEDPENSTDLDRLEELWLSYEWKKTTIKVGKQLLQTPFINYQDGRMRPTEEDGIWIQSKALPKIKIQGGWIYKISPRSTVRWYPIGTSIGLYPKGLNPDGTESGYVDALESKGIALMGLEYQPVKGMKWQFWNQTVENIFNTAFVQGDMEWPLGNTNTLFAGLQGMHQNALNEGGNPDQSKSYFLKNGQSNALSTQFGWKNQQLRALIAYTRVSADGRFLSPREWGREPFYTFMARERIEGSGDSHSIVARLAWQLPNKRFSSELAYGQFYLPEAQNAALNKYVFPSFRQINLDLRYRFAGWLKGLQVQSLVVYKGLMGQRPSNDRYVINRVNMWNYNLVLNYIF